MTYKGPRDIKARVKSRLEIQTHVADAKAMRSLLQAVGLAPTITVRKRRTSYRLGRCMVELDELPKIGCFVEIEAPSAAAVERMRKKLDLPGPAITDSYAHMLAEQGG